MILARLRWFLGRLVSPVRPGAGSTGDARTRPVPNDEEAPVGGPEQADGQADGPWLVVGLGNPGPSYAGHRHNVGYLVADELAQRLGSRWRAHKSGRADVVEGRLGPPGQGGARVVLARPRSFMNEVGGPVKALATFYRVPSERVVVVHDELDLGFGTLRVKRGGGDNGHNGLRSLRSSLDTGEFFRVRAGIGRPPGRQDVADFVLSDYAKKERSELPFQVDTAADAVESLVSEGLERTQQRFNS